MRAQTIQVFLPSGDPQGMRIASVPTRTVRVFEVPRKLLPEFLQRPESRQVGVYFLLGYDEQGNPMAYIGQSGDLSKRLKQHSDAKAFWSRVFVAVSLTNEWSQTHIAYLEWESIRQAKEAGRMPLENGNAGSRPHTPEPLLADCQEYLETVKQLLSTLSFPLLDRAKRGDTQESDDDGLRVRLKGRGCEAFGVYSSEGLLVLAGSRGRVLEPTFDSSHVRAPYAKIHELASEGVLEIIGGTTRFLRDYLFATPSGAASVIYCSAANGRTEWSDERGRTIADLEAAALNIDEGGGH